MQGCSKNGVAWAIVSFGLGILFDKFISGGALLYAVILIAIGVWLICCTK
jgi:hypothetical protein